LSLRRLSCWKYLDDAEIMILSREDSALFYRLSRSVLAYTNRRLSILQGVATAEEVAALPLHEVVKLRDGFYGKVELLTRYLDENPSGFAPEDLAIIASGRHRVTGNFYILRHLKPYTVLASENPAHLYGVLGLEQPIEDVLNGAPLPAGAQAVLLPFRDRIIYDGLMRLYRITYGPGIRRDMNETYRRLKDSEGIIEALTGPGGNAQSRTSLLRKRNQPVRRRTGAQRWTRSSLLPRRCVRRRPSIRVPRWVSCGRRPPWRGRYIRTARKYKERSALCGAP
jgi:hypothetical protein